MAERLRELTEERDALKNISSDDMIRDEMLFEADREKARFEMLASYTMMLADLYGGDLRFVEKIIDGIRKREINGDHINRRERDAATLHRGRTGGVHATDSRVSGEASPPQPGDH
jgi:hypothetical protein